MADSPWLAGGISCRLTSCTDVTSLTCGWFIWRGTLSSLEIFAKMDALLLTTWFALTVTQAGEQKTCCSQSRKPVKNHQHCQEGEGWRRKCIHLGGFQSCTHFEAVCRSTLTLIRAIQGSSQIYGQDIPSSLVQGLRRSLYLSWLTWAEMPRSTFIHFAPATSFESTPVPIFSSHSIPLPQSSRCFYQTGRISQELLRSAKPAAQSYSLVLLPSFLISTLKGSSLLPRPSLCRDRDLRSP